MVQFPNKYFKIVNYLRTFEMPRRARQRRPVDLTDDGKRHRNYCFTINNPKEEDCNNLRDLKLESKYLLMGNENNWKYGILEFATSRPNSTHHFQCFVILKDGKTKQAFKRIVPRAHFQPCNGSPESNIVYCTKDGEWIEYGPRPMSQEQKGEAGGEAEKQRWTHMRDLAKVRDWETFETEYPRELTLYEGSFQRIAIQHGPTLDLEDNSVVGIWIYGPTGTGKTYHVMHNMVPDRSMVYSKNISKWWDGYKQEQHSLVLIDDLSKFHVKIADDLKVWVQEYEFNAEFKGGSFRIRPKQIVVTSNYRIADIWEDAITRETLWRRFKCFKKMTKDGHLETDD
nr:putative replication associated protein [Crucivirus sp.]